MLKKIFGKKDGNRGGSNNNVTYRMNPDGKTGVVELSLAHGSVLNRFQNGPSDIFPERNIYRTGPIPENFHDLVPIMRHHYENDPLFGTVIDVLVQLSIDNAIHNMTDDKDAKDFFDAIIETSNLKRAVKGAFLEYHLLANVWTYRTNTGEMVRSRSGKDVPKYDWTVLNPEFVHVKGSLLFNNPTIVISPPDEFEEWDKEALNFLSTEQKKIMNSLRSGKDIPLDPSRVYHIARNKQPFQRYAPVSLKRVIKPLRIKEKYMQMDLSTADGIINQIVVFKLGSDDFPATPGDLKKFSELVQTPSKAYQLVWNHALETETIRTDVTVLDPKKYEFINRELMYGFAVPEVLVGGAHSSYSKDWVAVKSLIERLKWARDDIVTWIEREFQVIADENKLKTWPTVKLNPINFEEERTFKNVLMNLYQSGIMSAQTVLENVGFEFMTEVEQLKVEKDLRDKEGIFVSNSPYHQSRDAGRPEGSEDGEPRDERTPLPNPIGSGDASVSVASLNTHSEDIEKKYLALLSSAYDEARIKIADVISNRGNRDLSDVIGEVFAILLAFRDEMKELGDTHIREAYKKSFTRYKDVEDGDEYELWLSRVERWNELYVDKLQSEMQGMIEDVIIDMGDSITSEHTSQIFNNEYYRIPHFAREAIRKASLAGSLSAHISLGHYGGVWNATFVNSCEVCVDRHGRSFSASELMTIFPAHPRCRCFITFPEDITKI